MKLRRKKGKKNESHKKNAWFQKEKYLFLLKIHRCYLTAYNGPNAAFKFNGFLFTKERQPDCKPSSKKKSQILNSQITAFISRGLKNIVNRCRSGTIIIKKNGNANEKLDDLTVHRTTNANTCTNVYTCIFHAGTRRTYGSGGWYLTGMKNNPSL